MNEVIEECPGESAEREEAAAALDICSRMRKRLRGLLSGYVKGLLHFFPAEVLQRRHNASFAAWVLRYGIKLGG